MLRPSRRLLAIGAVAGLTALAAGATSASASITARKAAATVTAGRGATSSVTTATSTSPKPATLLRQAVATARAATSVHIREVSGTAPNTTVVDASITRTGATGTITDRMWGTIQVIRSGPALYVKAGARFWTAFPNDSDPAQLAGHWVRVTNSPTGTFVDAVSSELTLNWWVKDTAALRATGMIKGKSVRGIPAIALTSPPGRLYVAAKGKPYLLRFERADHQWSIDYDRWNAKVTVTAPKTALHATL